MPPKKKVVTSGFSVLMKELQDKYAREGRNIPMSQMKDLAEPVWKNMTPEQKTEYNQHAKVLKGQQRMTTEKLASDGTSIRQNFEEVEEKVMEDRQMRLEIREHINGNAEVEQFKSFASGHGLYVISFNILCCVHDTTYIPLEVGIAHYSVQRGIIRNYHKFINPGRIPTGYTGEAKRHSAETHQIPFSGEADCESDYDRIWHEICQFVNLRNPEQVVSPVFCPSESMEQTSGCIMWLAEKAGYNLPSRLKVWDLGYLLYEMRAAAGEPLTSDLIANDFLKSNTFDYSVNTRCKFHEELDSPHCALGYSQRLCYLLSDSLCGVFGVEVTSKHLPCRALEDKPYEVLRPSTKKTEEMESKVIRSMRPKRENTSRSYDLDTFSDDEYDDSSSVRSFSTTSSASTYKSVPLPIRNMADLRVSAPSVAPGQGIGRGRSKKS